VAREPGAYRPCNSGVAELAAGGNRRKVEQNPCTVTSRRPRAGASVIAEDTPQWW
jgi:hypothetical protein